MVGELTCMSKATIINGNKPSTEHARIVDGAKAVGRYVLCEMRAAKKTSGGLYVPDDVKQALAYVVRSVGPKVADACGTEIKPGDRVVFNGGVHMQLGSKHLHLVDAASIVLVLDRNSAGEWFDNDAPAVLTSMVEVS